MAHSLRRGLPLEDTARMDAPASIYLSVFRLLSTYFCVGIQHWSRRQHKLGCSRSRSSLSGQLLLLVTFPAERDTKRRRTCLCPQTVYNLSMHFKDDGTRDPVIDSFRVLPSAFCRPRRCWSCTLNICSKSA